ncbi:MAG: hypothetical protein GY788_15570 [bacterium]|nr:hypothetical protein [bacterium]
MKVVVNLERRIDPAAAKRLLELIFGDAIRREAARSVTATEPASDAVVVSDVSARQVSDG